MYVQEQHMLQQMELMNTALSVEAMASRAHAVSVASDRRFSLNQQSQSSKEARQSRCNCIRLLSVPTDAHWCRRKKTVLTQRRISGLFG